MNSSTESDRCGQRYLVDLMLMRLGRWLRLMGKDVANPEGGSDWELMDQARREQRALVTRDRSLCESCRKAGLRCLFISSSQIEEQLLEMTRAGVALQLKPLRCTLCNGELEECGEGGNERWQCRKCHKVYWKGSHWKNMEMKLMELSAKRGK